MYRITRDNFERIPDGFRAVNVANCQVGLCNIGVNILVSKSRWGVLGGEYPAAIIYMDINTLQPPGIRLKSATVLVSLEESQNYDARGKIPQRAADEAALNFTDWYGPKQMLRTGQTKKRMNFTPNSNVLGAGIGVERKFSLRWSFNGQLLPGSKTDPKSWLYRTLRWDIDGTESIDPPPTIHTGFALEHGGRPFILKVEVEGRAAKPRLWTTQFNFGPRYDNAGRGILFDPTQMRQTSHHLDHLAQGLPRSMEMENLAEIPVELPSLQFGREETVATKKLPLAAASGNLALVEELLSTPDGELVDEVDENGRTALSLSASHGHLDVVKRLLQAKAKPAKGDNQRRTPLSWAAGNGHLAVAKLLAREEAEFIPDKSGRTPLSHAAARGHPDIVELLLERMPGPDVADNEGKTALAWAAQEGREDIVAVFLQSYESNSLAPGSSGLLHSDSRTSSSLTDDLIDMPLNLAAQNDHLSVLCMLVQAGLEASPDKRTWLTLHLHDAIQNGSFSLVKVMFQFGAGADMKSQVSERTPLCTAAEFGQASIIPFLLDSGARLEEPTAEGETPLFLASINGREEAVRVLLDAGADISTRNTKGQVISDIAEDFPTILRMISEMDKDGKLAEADPHADISQEFNAKVVFFSTSSGITRASSKGVLVSALLADPLSFHPTEAGEVKFKWFHLPANNMRWVEALISRHYGSHALAYKVLKPDRWVGRQHQGEFNAHQARFMQPLCQGFGPVAVESTSSEEVSNSGDRDMVIFMPYLHWEENEQLDGTKSVIRNGASQTGSANWTKEQKLVYTYLFKDNPHPLHLLHIRRTLDQFGYYTLSNTDKRDKDQTVTRYQREFQLRPEITAVADQMWLWVLVGPSGHADTVISCFPTKDGTQARSGADPDGFTDVLQNVMLYMLDEPQAVRTAYDLAGVIASRCSRAFLAPSRAPASLQFAEIYESAISNIVNKETELFDVFRTLTEFRRKEPNPAETILEMLSKLKKHEYVDPFSLQALAQENYNDTLSPEIPNASDMAMLSGRGASLNSGKTIEILQKLGNFHVLDISREIMLLREIKDIQDELSTMSMVFQEQMGVMKDMERTVRSIEKNSIDSFLPSNQLLQTPPGDSDVDQQEKTDTATDLNPIAARKVEGDLKEDAGAEDNDSTPSTNADDNGEELYGLPKNDGANPTTTSDRDRNIIWRSQVLKYMEEARPASEIWGSSRDTKQTSLPLVTVQLSVDEIDRMARRAANANHALNFLVDLKQKQSNVLDARAARIQAEESLKMTKESEKQGKTIMIFTIVTIVFLPLSFLAAFFALNITQFQRDDGGTLGLGYVLEIMVPISAVVSFSFIYVAFKAENLGAGLGGLARLFGSTI